MQTTEINGFEIDIFNQYKLKEGSRGGICPLCSEHRSAKNQNAKVAAYDWDRGLGTCNHCNEVFQLHTFKRKGGPDKVYVRPEFLYQTPTEKVVEWFKSRGISEGTLSKAKVGIGTEWMPQTQKKENTIQFNYFIGEELINIKYRDGAKNFKLVKDAEKVFYNINAVINTDSCIIVEGEMDALSLIESGIPNVISVPNGATITRNNLDYLDNCIDYLTDKEKIIIAVDSDEAGQALQSELIRRLGAEVCYTASFGECKDANEALTTRGGQFVRDAINSASAVPLEHVITLNEISDELEDFVHNGFKPGFQVGLENFDSIFSTYTGQFITVTGVPSSGKSDFVDRMCVGYNQKYGWKTAYASPENQPVFLHGHKLIRKVWGGMPEKEDIGTERWNKVTNHINDNFFFIDMERYTLEHVLKKGAELVKRKGIKVLVIDPYNKVTAEGKNSMNVNDYTMEYLAKIDHFCKKYDVLVFIVAHPTKLYKDQNGNMEEPSMYSIKGGGEWYDASYHGILVHRDYVKKTVKAKVLKVKFQNLGENQAEAHFTWDSKSGDYTPHEPMMIDTVPWE